MKLTILSKSNTNPMVKNIETLFAAFIEDAKKAENGNKLAGARARKVSLTIANELKAFRAESVKWAKEGK